MEIRQLNRTDAEDYLSIRLEALQSSPYAFASSYEEEKNQTAEKYKNRFTTPANTFTFGAFEESQLVGVVTLITEQLIKLNHRANIVAMYIKPEKRGIGLGKDLILKVLEKAYRLEGIEQIYLSVVTTNIPAKKLYASCGFEIIGKEKRALKIDNTYYDEEHMVLFL
ncbi:GNAT family N-acetyltransferase [Virgibacillus sp. C22-A2]|uniref:GNAT family N-acetyltransferase n=1 Tax=Virgibacillus tibetensis TaxID=3042313 RepID=A0ABU6KKF6_9BACI|nr:GNAT family N-acetyltransferase [Virgibacillus sp. C22-A2]